MEGSPSWFMMLGLRSSLVAAAAARTWSRVVGTRASGRKVHLLSDTLREGSFVAALTSWTMSEGPQIMTITSGTHSSRISAVFFAFL